MSEDGFKDAAGFAHHMQERIFILEAPESLDVEELRTKLDTEGCGAIVSFVGITRGIDGDEEVLRLEFDAWQEKLSETLHSLAVAAIQKFSLHSVAMAHRTGSVGPGENIVAIHVSSPHRKEAFEGCSWLIDELKRQAPLWKKEVKPSGASWKAGLG
tara:strand:- start:128 stop:598 length:471 start_codon:yes stop_codon:yes gene_type:complete